jgi:protein O-mannosyl-transferase
MRANMPDRLKILLEKFRPHLLSLLLLTIAALAVYGRILGHEFLSNWDDNKYVLENPDVHGISWTHIKAVFTKYYSGNYAPVHMLSYMLDYAIWGLWPGGYLLTNLLLHILNGLLIYRMFLRLIGGRLAAFSGAAFFLLHPVQVESVAWISQRKNLLAMLFFLLAWELYNSYRINGASRGRLYYVASLTALLLALLSKSVAVIFPIVIIAFDHCYLSTSGRCRIIDKVPYLVATAVVAAVAIHSQTPDYTEWGAGGGRAAYHGGSAVTTFMTMLPVFCRYLGMIVWPTGLSSYYSPVLHGSPDVYVVAAALLLVGVFLSCYRLYRCDRRTGFWPMLIFTAFLPVSQIVPLVTMMNDRYLYFPLVGVAGLAGCAVEIINQKKPQRTALIAAMAAILLFFLAFISFKRVPVWRDARTLWSDAAEKTPNNALVWEGLGESYHYTAKPDLLEAIKAYSRALELSPKNDMSQYNLGVAYLELNDYVNADRVLLELLQRSPENVMGWAAYGDLALRRFDYAEAGKRYKRALELQPEAVQVHRKIGNLMVVTGRFDEARSSFLRIEALQGGNDPLNAYELARIEALVGDTGASIRWLEAALQRGYNDFAGIMADEELTPVMSDGRFADLVNKYFQK